MDRVYALRNCKGADLDVVCVTLSNCRFGLENFKAERRPFGFFEGTPSKARESGNFSRAPRSCMPVPKLHYADAPKQNLMQINGTFKICTNYTPSVNVLPRNTYCVHNAQTVRGGKSLGAELTGIWRRSLKECRTVGRFVLFRLERDSAAIGHEKRSAAV